MMGDPLGSFPGERASEEKHAEKTHVGTVGTVRRRSNGRDSPLSGTRVVTT